MSDQQPLVATPETLAHEINGVKTVLVSTLTKAMDRGGRIDDLQDKATELQRGSRMFARSSRGLKRNYQCQNWTFWVILITVVLILILIIALMAVYGHRE